MKYNIIFFAILIAFSSCMKNDLRQMNKARKKLAGTYEIQNVVKTTYDTTGHQLTTSTLNSPGNIELIYTGEDDEVFFAMNYPAVLESQTAVFDYLSELPEKYWDADPSEVRICLWSIGNGTSYHLTLNMEKDGDDYTWTYIKSNSASSPSGNTMDLKEVYTLKKTD